MEKDAVLAALEYYDYSRTDAARALGISCRGLRNKLRSMKREGIRIPKRGKKVPTREIIESQHHWLIEQNTKLQDACDIYFRALVMFGGNTYVQDAIRRGKEIENSMDQVH